MAAFAELFGEQLLSKDASVNTKEALGKDDLKAVAIYFSAHWCPPCRGFTPQLAELYTTQLKAKGLEIVFVSSDKDADQFKDYYAEMPWLALPYDKRDVKEALSKKYKVNGIPSLVILDAKTGEVITLNGRAVVAEVEDFPWYPKTWAQEIEGAEIMTKDGSKKPFSSICKNQIIGIYFSAHWCPPCQAFTPFLAQVYEKVKAREPDFEIVFVSSDRDEEAFKSYYESMPWVALDYSNQKLKKALNSRFEVNGIPNLTMLNTADGTVVSKNARSWLDGDEEGLKFPWAPPLAIDVATRNIEGIDEIPSLLAVLDTLEEADQKRVIGEMEAISKELKDAKPEDSEYMFFYTKDEEPKGPMEQIANLTKLPKANERKGKADAVTAILLDMDKGGAYYELKEPLNDKSIRGFLANFKDGKLERMQLA